MPKKKVKKIRGTRTCGYGKHKEHRGAGHRGGRGNAGAWKHKKIKYHRLAELGLYEYGKHGFVRPKSTDKRYLNEKSVKSTLKRLLDEGKMDEYTYKYLSSRTELNVRDLDVIADRLVSSGLAEKINGLYKIDLEALGYSKLLGAGKVTKAMEVKVSEATEKAIEKIKAAGGNVIA